jgi:opacity protein-like surface antigen
MTGKKIYARLGVTILTLVLLALPGAARAETYVEAYVGGVGAADFYSSQTHGSLSVSPAVIGGLKIGTWFVPTGFLGYQYPDWMKYVGFYTDFSYQRLDVPQQRRRGGRVAPVGAVVTPGLVDIQSEGTVATWAFMFAARYGFFQDSEVPFGRLQPYVAVGPAVMFSTRDLKLSSPAGPALSQGSESSANIALTVEAGLRYMMLKNVSLDASFKYRFASPRFVFDSMDWRPDYDLFSGQLGVAYHF